MIHEVEIRGSELEGFWFNCCCGAEGKLWDTPAPAEMEGTMHELTAGES